ncbi:hypothetical protein P167DRAFT_532801 [Morchella conica CCBAS932]|uniref:Uncharacterized protein n=1 Tax=Morchella conica CCBAS932 TaxID=1392247 RepID=A0A3N4KZ65_9PEZI|nr:hypothetical protein P167DRAFT_532801 [Morchella conica CCBAS932]
MCNFTINYYYHQNCMNREKHAVKLDSSEGGMSTSTSVCREGPHKIFKLEPGECPECRPNI